MPDLVLFITGITEALSDALNTLSRLPLLQPVPCNCYDLDVILQLSFIYIDVLQQIKALWAFIMHNMTFMDKYQLGGKQDYSKVL